MIYLDNAATTRVSGAAAKAMLNCLRNDYGNPSSVHMVGQSAKEILEDARHSIARLVGADPSEIYFTSGGTESDNWAILAAAEVGKKKGKRHIVSTRFEHHAVLHTLEKLEREGFEVTLLDVYSDGIVRLDELENAIREDTALVTVIYANNEIGTIQPIAEIGSICRSRGAPFHTDAVQAVGHLPVDVRSQNIDMLSLSAHKFHGPKGIGALYCRKGLPLPIFIEGGAQERGKRGGTENVPAIAGMAVALEEAYSHLEKNNKNVEAMRDRLIEAFSAIPHCRLNGHREKRLPGIANFCFEGVEGESVLLLLDQASIFASSGSACTSGSLEPSHVLLALGIPHEIAHGSLRISLSEYNTTDEIETVIDTLTGVIERLRGMSPVWEKITKGEQI